MQSWTSGGRSSNGLMEGILLEKKITKCDTVNASKRNEAEKQNRTRLMLLLKTSSTQ